MKVPVLRITLGIMAIILTTQAAYSNAASCVGIIGLLNFAALAYESGQRNKN